MIRILNANLKKFMGARYERIPKTVLIWAILFLALRSSEISIEIAPVVVWLTTLFLTVGGFVQVLSSEDTIDSLRGQLMLPENPAKFHTAFFLSVLLYTVLTKAGMLLMVYLAVSRFQLSAVIGFFVCVIVGGMATYPFAFRTQKKVTKNRYITHTRGNFAFYLLRYLTSNKKYLVNTIALWVFGCIFAAVMGKNVPADFLPLGFALMCFNTPLGILLSSDRTLYRQVRLLPNQAACIFLPYAFFVAAINMIACGIYLAVWRVETGSFSPYMLLFAVLVSIVSAGFTVALEIKYPLLNWKVESDLWHNPRKYIVPGIVIFFALSAVTLIGGL